MSRATVIVDGETVLDEDLNIGQWQQQPPAFLADLAGRETKPAPHLQAVGIVLVNALIRSKGVAIDVRTDVLGWDMRVTHDCGES